MTSSFYQVKREQTKYNIMFISGSGHFFQEYYHYDHEGNLLLIKHRSDKIFACVIYKNAHVDCVISNMELVCEDSDVDNITYVKFRHGVNEVDNLHG